MLIGIVGKPNAGKSTFFKAATLADVEIANYAFTTIKANQAIGYVSTDCVEAEFNVRCRPRHGFCINAKRFIPVKLIDVAGLVPKAHEGRGLGNKFLDDLRQADVLILIVDTSGTTDEEGKPTTNYDVCNDVRFIIDELNAWMLQLLKKDWLMLKRKIKIEHISLVDALAEKFSGLKITHEQIKKAIAKAGLSETPDRSDEQLENFVCCLRSIAKPIIVFGNKIDIASKQNITKLEQFCQQQGLSVVFGSAEIELALREAAHHGLIKYVPGSSTFEIFAREKLNEKQRQALSKIKMFLQEHPTGVQEVINKAVFGLLKYKVVYPVENEKLTDKDGNVLPDALLMPEHATALDLAEAIHSDLAKNFVAAIDVRTGKRLSKDYVLKHNDVIRIVTS